MPRKVQNTKGRIVSAAWELFYEQGYDNTTVEDILARGRFTTISRGRMRC